MRDQSPTSGICLAGALSSSGVCGGSVARTITLVVRRFPALGREMSVAGHVLGSWAEAFKESRWLYWYRYTTKSILDKVCCI